MASKAKAVAAGTVHGSKRLTSLASAHSQPASGIGQLSDDQAQALDELTAFVASDRTRHALAGPAGSGKTYVIGQFLRTVKAPVRLTASTNKAAAVAARMAPGTEARTIHSLLGLKPEEDHRRGRMVLKRKRDPRVKAGELVIVDEASMVDSELLAVIDDYAAEIGFRVLYVGDSFQLAPIFERVSPAFDKVPTSRLTTVHRQALENPLLATATAFRRVLDGFPFPIIESCSTGLLRVPAAAFEAEMLSAFDSEAYAADEDHVRAIAWSNARVAELNEKIRRRLIGSEADRHPFTDGETFVVNEAVADNDRLILPTESRVHVLSTRRDKITANGITVKGYRVEVEHQGDTVEVFCPTDRAAAVAALGPFAKAARALQREFEKTRDTKVDRERRAVWRAFFAIKRHLAELRPPHACTVHKSQGSTYRQVFVDVGDIGRCTRSDVIVRLVYVALTRPSTAAIVTGDLPARLYATKEAA